MSTFSPKADMGSAAADVRFGHTLAELAGKPLAH